ncbi:hypothetical protein ACW949_00750 [Paraburkholderia strydomiana]
MWNEVCEDDARDYRRLSDEYLKYFPQREVSGRFIAQILTGKYGKVGADRTLALKGLEIRGPILIHDTSVARFSMKHVKIESAVFLRVTAKGRFQIDDAELASTFGIYTSHLDGIELNNIWTKPISLPTADSNQGGDSSEDNWPKLYLYRSTVDADFRLHNSQINEIGLEGSAIESIDVQDLRVLSDPSGTITLNKVTAGIADISNINGYRIAINNSKFSDSLTIQDSLLTQLLLGQLTIDDALLISRVTLQGQGSVAEPFALRSVMFGWAQWWYETVGPPPLFLTTTGFPFVTPRVRRESTQSIIAFSRAKHVVFTGLDMDLPLMFRFNNVTSDWSIDGGRLASIDASYTTVGRIFAILAATRWQPNSTLILKQSTLNQIQTPYKMDVWPATIDMRDATYDSIVQEEGEDEVSAASNNWFRHWIALWSAYPFSTQPYRQLIAYLAKIGNERAATEVGYAFKERERQTACVSQEYLTCAILWLSRFAIGYGYKLWYAVIWAISFVIIGGFVFSQTEEAKERGMPWGLTYSFDMLIPLIKLRDSNYNIDIQGPTRYYFYAHKLAGWVLSSFLAAGLGGWTK